MKLRNNFDKNSRTLFDDAWTCWYCGMNTCDSLHHIVGRGEIGSTVESSILNAAPMCNQKCHLIHHGKLMTSGWQIKLLHKTYSYLEKIGYNIDDNDRAFIEKYKMHYSNSIVRENSIKKK